jgi:hypothetical protein
VVGDGTIGMKNLECNNWRKIVKFPLKKNFPDFIIVFVQGKSCQPSAIWKPHRV